MHDSSPTVPVGTGKVDRKPDEARGSMSRKLRTARPAIGPERIWARRPEAATKSTTSRPTVPEGTGRVDRKLDEA